MKKLLSLALLMSVAVYSPIHAMAIRILSNLPTYIGLGAVFYKLKKSENECDIQINELDKHAIYNWCTESKNPKALASYKKRAFTFKQDAKHCVSKWSDIFNSSCACLYYCADNS